MPTPDAGPLSLGNADLDPEKSVNYEAGFVYSSPALGLDTSLMVFHTRFRDKILSDRFCESPASVGRDDVDDYACEFGGNTFLFLQTGMNVDEAMMQGVELTLDYALSPVVGLSASYTYTETEQKSGEFRGKPLNKQPRHMANALLD